MSSQPPISARKADHLDLCTDGDVAFRAKTNLFEQVGFIHDALPEMASPLGQMIVLGCVFFLIFASYYMEQGFASDLFGATLASDTLVALYAAFTVGCFFAPCVVNFYGAKPSLVAGAAG